MAFRFPLAAVKRVRRKYRLTQAWQPALAFVWNRGRRPRLSAYDDCEAIANFPFAKDNRIGRMLFKGQFSGIESMISEGSPESQGTSEITCLRVSMRCVSELSQPIMRWLL